MAEIFPDEGLDLILGQFPKNATRLTQLGLNLFSSQSASTVMTSGQTLSSVTESVWTNYVAQTLATATWGSQAAGSGGRKTTYPQVTFPTCGATGGTVNGFYIADDPTDTKVVCQANFDDTTAVVLASGDIIKVTPFIQFNN